MTKLVQPAATAGLASNRLAVRLWLYSVVAVLFVLVLVGGATRLTESGLSITEWKPVLGILPPIGQAAWEAEFAKYQLIPEYQLLNKGMGLDAFKTIYWWEWSHRLLARGVGLVFALPFLFFLVTGRIESHLKLKLAVIFALGALQGAIGWWMVASGLVDRVDVSQYRLAVHLTLACLIFAATLYVARGLAPHTGSPAPDGVRQFAGWLVLLILFQIYLGGLVAGLDAGLAFNTWPLMDGRIIPQNLLAIEPAWRNFFESPKTVQFVHRMSAYLIWIAAVWHVWETFRSHADATHRRRALILFLAISAQAVAGIVTLVLQVPFYWALAHQGLALIVLGFAVAHWRGCIGAYPAAAPGSTG